MTETSNSINILLLFGGGGAEHEISRISSQFLNDQLCQLSKDSSEEIFICTVELLANQKWQYQNKETREYCFLNENNELEFENNKIKPIKINFSIPCFHGPPGETGEIPAFLTLKRLPYLGSSFEGHMLCFNKIQTKLLLESHGLPIVPFKFVDLLNEYSIETAENLYDQYGGLYVKSSHQGSSVGCHYVQNKNELSSAIEDALKHSPFALLEKPMNARELEVAVYELDNQIKVSRPGEIICESGFYDYNEKYSDLSETKTLDLADIDESISHKIQSYALEAFRLFKLKDLARIDFFLSGNEIYINEINTFPGLTPISMFPKMVAKSGDQFQDIIKNKLQKNK